MHLSVTALSDLKWPLQDVGRSQGSLRTQLQVKLDASWMLANGCKDLEKVDR